MSTTHPVLPEQKPEAAKTQPLVTPSSLELHEALRRENDQLRTALGTRIVIEQAKGMLAERFEVDVDEAFERLRREARNRRMKLHVLATAVVTGEAWLEPVFRRGGWRDDTARRSGCTEKSAVGADHSPRNGRMDLEQR